MAEVLRVEIWQCNSRNYCNVLLATSCHKARLSPEVRSMLERSPRQRNLAVCRAETLREMLLRALPPMEIDFFTTAFEEAAARYDRYFASRHELSNYGDRRRRLTNVRDLAVALASNLSELDIFSWDELARRTNPNETKKLMGSLNLLGSQVSGLIKESQRNGSPRDLAQQQWIEEVADLYENAFGQSADANWKAFHRVLQLSRPVSLPRHGKLHLRQVKRALQRRRTSNQIDSGG